MNNGWLPIESAPRDGTEFLACQLESWGWSKYLCEWMPSIDDWFNGDPDCAPKYWQPWPEDPA